MIVDPDLNIAIAVSSGGGTPHIDIVNVHRIIDYFGGVNIVGFHLVITPIGIGSCQGDCIIPNGSVGMNGILVIRDGAAVAEIPGP